MADISLFDPIRVPVSYLTALDNRAFHFVFQRWHYLTRLAHVLSSACFFGIIVLLDIELILARPVRAGSSVMIAGNRLHMRMLSLALLLALLTGLPLFLFDPVRVGSHAYFSPKMLLIAAGLVNALLFARLGIGAGIPVAMEQRQAARMAGTISLLLWTGAMACASLNAEGVPKIFLR